MELEDMNNSTTKLIKSPNGNSPIPIDKDPINKSAQNTSYHSDCNANISPKKTDVEFHSQNTDKNDDENVQLESSHENDDSANVSPKKYDNEGESSLPSYEDVEAEDAKEPSTQQTTEKSFWRDHPKIGAFVTLFAILGLVAICVATYFVAKENPSNWNCNETACKVGTGVVTGVKGVIAGISYVMCKYQYGLSCGVYPVTSLMSAAIGSGIQLCSLCGRGEKPAECETKGGEKCVFPFRYNGTNYHGCTRDGASHAWCATSVDGNGNVGGHWGLCKAGCPKPPKLCRTEKGQECVFPFVDHGKSYNGCTRDSSANGRAWCATAVDEDGKVLRGDWGYCKPGCPFCKKDQGNLPPCSRPEWINDGVCDEKHSEFIMDHCKFDGGDCCNKKLSRNGKCEPENDFETCENFDGGDCLEQTAPNPPSLPHCSFPKWIKDGTCDKKQKGFILEQCQFDGGDCCQKSLNGNGICEPENNFETCGNYDGGDCIGTSSPNPISTECECNKEHKNGGECRIYTVRGISGPMWCYIDSTSKCKDKKESERYPGHYYSFNACKI